MEQQALAPLMMKKLVEEVAAEAVAEVGEVEVEELLRDQAEQHYLEIRFVFQQLEVLERVVDLLVVLVELVELVLVVLV